MLPSMKCCDPNGLNQVFAGPVVQRELQAFKRKGLNRRQRKMVELLESGMPGASVLDVGCGIGAIGTTLLTKGAGSSTFVDVSSAYLRGAREIAGDAGVEERATFRHEDFATSENLYAQADVVVLDRVVCCYPDATTLLEKAAERSRQTLLFTYPRPFWFMPLFRALCTLGMRLTGREYRFFLHDPQLMLKAATNAGHTLVGTRPVGLWQLVNLRRHLAG